MPYVICQRWLANEITYYMEQLLKINKQNTDSMYRDDTTIFDYVVGGTGLAIMSPVILLVYGGFAIADAVDDNKWMKQVENSYNNISIINKHTNDTKYFIETLIKHINYLKQ